MGLHNEKLHDFFDRFGLPVADVQTGMKDAVEAAYKLAKKGETVLSVSYTHLISCACTAERKR